MLKLAKNLDLPIAAVTQTFAFLGTRGGGKTYAAGKLAEEMLSHKAQVIVLDVVGNWYGLRIPKDKRNAAFDLVIFGGRNGDVAINPKAGKIVAQAILTRNLSAVVDLSEFVHSEQTRFTYDFLTEIFEYRKAHPAACHIFIEEAQEIVPQNLPPATGGENYAARLLHIGNRVVKLGRNYGIGCSLISQRPQEVNKKVLEMCEVTLAFRMTGINMRKTIETLVKDQDTGVDVNGILPSLDTGQAFVWSPNFLEVADTYKISEKITADVSATPVVGAESVHTQKLEPRDVTELTESISKLTADMEANTPAALKKRIAELEKEVIEANKNIPKAVAAAATRVETITETVEVPIFPYEAAEMIDNVCASLAQLHTDFGKFGDRLSSDHDKLRKQLTMLKTLPESVERALPSQKSRPQILNTPRNSASNERPKHAQRPMNHQQPKSLAITKPVAEYNGDIQLNKKQQQILDALAFYESIGNNSPSLVQIGAVALIDATGGHFSNTVGPLSSQGLVVRERGQIQLTDTGRQYASVIDAPASLSDYHEVLCNRVRKMKSASGRTIDVLRTIIAAGGDALTNEQIGSAIGIDHTGGHFSNTVGPLSTAGLITRGNRMVRPTEVLFPEGLY